MKALFDLDETRMDDLFARGVLFESSIEQEESLG
jgi:hypothetical protein